MAVAAALPFWQRVTQVLQRHLQRCEALARRFMQLPRRIAPFFIPGPHKLLRKPVEFFLHSCLLRDVLHYAHDSGDFPIAILNGQTSHPKNSPAISRNVIPPNMFEFPARTHSFLKRLLNPGPIGSVQIVPIRLSL